MLRLLACGLAWMLLVAAAQPPQKAASHTTLTGILDEEAGAQYVIREENELNLLARLKPVGFANENFARYVGQKVSVTGKLDRSSTPPVMHVEKIRKASEAP